MSDLEIIVKELGITLGGIKEEETAALVKAVLEADRIFLAGCGRSGLMVKAFAMRLMHMGLKVSVIGEVTTPSITDKDLLIIASGSGETGSLVSMAKKTKDIGAKLATVTIYPKATIGSLADVIVHIDAPTAKSEEATENTSIQPMGSLFEQSLLLYLDSVILALMKEKKTTSEIMFRLHANLE